MGMDAYLYSTRKSDHLEYKLHRDELVRIRKELSALYKDIKEKEPSFDGDYEKISKKSGLEDVVKKYRELDDAYGKEKGWIFDHSGNTNEIAYWRKNYIVHEYIVNNFGDPENDNCVRIPLKKKDIKKILSLLCGRRTKNSVNPFLDFDEDERKDAYDKFSCALYEAEAPGTVIFYYAWY